MCTLKHTIVPFSILSRGQCKVWVAGSVSLGGILTPLTLKPNGMCYLEEISCKYVSYQCSEWLQPLEHVPCVVPSLARTLQLFGKRPAAR